MKISQRKQLINGLMKSARNAHQAASAGLTRRRFVQAGSMIGLSLSSLRSASAASSSLEAYAGASSVKQGGTLTFYVRDPAGSLTADRTVGLWIGRIAQADVGMLYTTVKVRNRSVPANAYSAGCNWPATYTLTVPATWPSGLYYVVFGSDSNACSVPFVVGAKTQTAGAKVLVQVPVTTMQAYNAYGGKSLYTYNSSGGVAATKVSFDRPHTEPWNYAFDPWQPPLVAWLDKNGIKADFCTSLDLHQSSFALTGYQLIVTAGHDEYWSREMRNRLDAFVAAGGNVAVLSGNSCWWQIRMEANSAGKALRTMVCYKSATADPDTRAAYKTVNWIDLVPPYPENSSIGLSWRYGASWTTELPRPVSPFVVQRASHWAFAGTGLATGTGFGSTYVGYEIDSVQFTKATDTLAYPTFADSTPDTLTILALADASTWDAQAKALGLGGEKSGYGMLSIHTRGGIAGSVFNAGTTDWVLGLQPELDGQVATPISRITLNIITKLSAAYKECVDVRRHRYVQTSGDGARYFFTAHNDAPAGATLDGLAFRAHAAAVTTATSATAPVYRYKYPQSNGDGVRHLYSLSATVGGGWIYEGPVFHVYASQQTDSVPVYQHHAVQTNGDGWRFTYSTRSAEPGWVLDGVVFYAPVG